MLKTSFVYFFIKFEKKMFFGFFFIKFHEKQQNLNEDAFTILGRVQKSRVFMMFRKKSGVMTCLREFKNE